MIDVGRSSLAINQTLHYEVRHEPLDFIELEAPSWLAKAESLTLWVNDLPFEGDHSVEETAEGLAQLQLYLSEPKQGEFTVALK